MPYAQFLKEGISLQTENTPYGINFNYDFSQAKNTDGNVEVNLNHVETTLSNNAIIIFALIEAGEAATEGHIILDTEEKDGKIKAYTIASYGWFRFENGIFTTVSGSGAIPTVMTFAKNANGAYVLLQYQEPQDGALYLDNWRPCGRLSL